MVENPDTTCWNDYSFLLKWVSQDMRSNVLCSETEDILIKETDEHLQNNMLNRTE